MRPASSNCRSRQSRKTGSGVSFIPLGKRDFREISSVESAGQRRRWTDGMLREELGSVHGFHFGVKVPSVAGLCAFVLCRLFAGELHVHRLCTRPADRRRGYATALLRHVTAEAGKRGAERAFLEVGAANGTAVSLYRRLGFTVDSKRKKYYRDGNDALLMSRELT